MILRSRQRSFVERALRALDTHGNTLGVAPTGAGKTICLSAVTGAMLQHTEAKAQIARLEHVLALLGAGPGDDDCEAMEGIVAQAEELMEDDLPGEILDAALLVTALKVKHFEIASYRAVVALAEACGAREASATLQESLAEETRALRSDDAACCESLRLPARPWELWPQRHAQWWVC